MLAALSVANWMLVFSRKHGDSITNMKLQKLLYYAQAWHLAEMDSPLFEENLEAWIYGPVVMSVYREFKRFRATPIDAAGIKDVSCDDGLRKFLEEIMRVFGGYSSYQLELMTHAEDPWRKARGDLSPTAASRNVIAHSDMKEYYRALTAEE